MITSNEYASYDTFNDRQSIYQWLNQHQSIFSNRQDDFKTVINHHCDYKEKHQYVYGKKSGKKIYNTIYAHFLEIMIPNNMDDNQKHVFIKKYMSALHPCYSSKNFLYCYKFNSKGEGTYIEVMCFTRMYFKRKQHKTVRYTRDYYFNPVTKKISTADDKDAILKYKKGQAKVDKKGLVIKEDYYVSPSEKLIFKYKSFSRLRKRLIKQIQYVKLLINRDYWKQQTKFFSRITIKRSDWKNKDKLTSKNQMIIRLNSMINDMQLALYQTRAWYDLEHSFYKLLHKINSLLYLIKWKDSLSGKLIYLGTKQSITSYNDSLTLFESYLNDLIKDWWVNEMQEENTISINRTNKSVSVLLDLGEYWCDGNRNKWSKSRYTYDEAIEYSKTLVNCYDCINCLDCIECVNCIDCIECIRCDNCNLCYNCKICKDIYNNYNLIPSLNSNVQWNDQLIEIFTKARSVLV